MAIQPSSTWAQAHATHRWPGNIRELKNVIERSVILSKSSRDLNLNLALPASANMQNLIPDANEDEAILTE